MGVIYRQVLRPMLALQDSENAHSRTIKMLRRFGNNRITRFMISTIYKSNKKLPITVFGQEYLHPFGLAAGMDKKGEAINGWGSLGLSFAEIGGITMLEQSGNPKPRMFRSNNQKALVNRMGFNNPGSKNMQSRLENHFNRFGKPNIPIWVNLGKSKVTPNEDAHIDYATTLSRLWQYANLFVINVSSPNTPNLRDLQGVKELKVIIDACQKVNQDKSAEFNSKPKPLLVKVAPDMSLEQLEDIVTLAIESGCSGIVATNTTVARIDDLSADKNLRESGGMSGVPLRTTSTEFIRHIYRFTDGNFPIVGVGGIMNADDAWEKITAGASLLQAYSGFVFEGPSLGSNVVKGLSK
ncbi:MAG: dihydroorotate dehydrogenase (quinone), partial [Euryarchaeota archaeon]|nr:dihydroorotate dehydrogenase (quinone) [Euryarchaeota archaeon]